MLDFHLSFFNLEKTLFREWSNALLPQLCMSGALRQHRACVNNPLSTVACA